MLTHLTHEIRIPDAKCENATTERNMTNAILEIGLYQRPRRFRPAEYGSRKWWMLGFNQTHDSPSDGAEHIEILEIVATTTVGRLVIHRQWITDPDGNEYSDRTIEKSYKKLLFRNELHFECAMNRMGFVRLPEPREVMHPGIEHVLH
jgi:hypothetical protein